jgi:hypothetical protein
MRLISTIYEFIIKSNQDWNDLLIFINSLILSVEVDQHLAGIFMLRILIEESAKYMKSHFVNTLEIFYKILKEEAYEYSRYHVIISLVSMIPFINEIEMKLFKEISPYAITVSFVIIKSSQNKEGVLKIFNFYKYIIEYDLIFDEIQNLTQVVIRILNDSSLENSTRICSLNLMNQIIENKKKLLVQNNMIESIVDAVFNIMTNSKDPLRIKNYTEIDLFFYDELERTIYDESENLFTCASEVLDCCALHFPTQMFVEILIKKNLLVTASCETTFLRATLTSFAITCERCSVYYRNNHINFLAELCIKGLLDSNKEVVEIGYFTLSQFSEYLQPEILNYSEKFLLILIENFEVKTELNIINRLTIRFYEALQSFCENSSGI